MALSCAKAVFGVLCAGRIRSWRGEVAMIAGQMRTGHGVPPSRRTSGGAMVTWVTSWTPYSCGQCRVPLVIRASSRAAPVRPNSVRSMRIVVSRALPASATSSRCHDRMVAGNLRLQRLQPLHDPESHHVRAAEEGGDPVQQAGFLGGDDGGAGLGLGKAQLSQVQQVAGRAVKPARPRSWRWRSLPAGAAWPAGGAA